MTLPPNKPSKTAGEDLTPSSDAIEQDVLKKERDGDLQATPNSWAIDPKELTLTMKHPVIERLEQLTVVEHKIFQLSIWLCLGLAYSYVSSSSENALLPLTILAILFVEGLNHVLNRPLRLLFQKGEPGLEVGIFAGLTLLQALAFQIWGFQETIASLQFLGLRLSFLVYVAARNGLLIQNRLGILALFDLLYVSVILPIRNYSMGFTVLKFNLKKKEAQKQAHTKHLGNLTFIILGIGLALVLVTFAWGQLSQVSERFANLTGHLMTNLLASLNHFFASNWLSTGLSRLPFTLVLGFWLYGLLVGPHLYQRPKPFTFDDFSQSMFKLKVIPSITAYIVIASLGLIYSLFVATALTDLGTLLSATISPFAASSAAVDGFWQLVRVALLNFSIFAAFHLFIKNSIWEKKGPRLALTLLFIFTILFALLAAWKLFGVYILLYGPTPRRLLSGWFVLTLIAWSLLALLRLYKPIQACRLAIFYAAISFTLLIFIQGMLL